MNSDRCPTNVLRIPRTNMTSANTSITCSVIPLAGLWVVFPFAMLTDLPQHRY
jgi:hypothetical protein